MEFQAPCAYNSRKQGPQAGCLAELLSDGLLKEPALGFASLACFVFGMP